MKRGIQCRKLSIQVASRVFERIKTQDLRKKGNIRKISKLGWDIAQCPVSLPETKLAIAVQKHAKVDIKLFLTSPVLLDFSILFQILCPGLQVHLLRLLDLASRLSLNFDDLSLHESTRSILIDLKVFLQVVLPPVLIETASFGCPNKVLSIHIIWCH